MASGLLLSLQHRRYLRIRPRRSHFTLGKPLAARRNVPYRLAVPYLFSGCILFSNPAPVAAQAQRLRLTYHRIGVMLAAGYCDSTAFWYPCCGNIARPTLLVLE